MSPQTPANGRRTDLAWLALILAVGGTCRFLWLGWASVWEDEIVWMTLARMDGPTALVRALPTLDAGGSPLHPLLLQAWLGVVGDSVIAARVASALCGMATIALIYAIGRRYFDGPTGLAAALLAALNPLDVHHAREVRVYPWLVFLTCAGWFLLDSFRQGAPAWKRVLYASVLIALLYSHPLGSLMVVALGVGYLVTRRESRLGGWGWIGINLCAAAAFAPWASRHLDHPPQVTVPHWDAWVLLEWPEGFTGGRAEAVGACVALVLFGMIWRAKRGPKTGLDRGDRLTLAWFFVPTLLLLAYSATRHPIFGPRRYLLFVGPAYLLLIARGISAIPRPALRVAALATLALVAGSAMIRRSYARDRADWQGVAALVRREDPRAPVVFMDEAGRDVHRGCLGYYLPPGHRPISASEPGMIGTLSASAPPSLWYVIESAPAFPAVPVPGELSARYLSERTWKRPNVTVVHARIRGIEQAAASGPASRAR